MFSSDRTQVVNILAEGSESDCCDLQIVTPESPQKGQAKLVRRLMLSGLSSQIERENRVTRD